MNTLNSFAELQDAYADLVKENAKQSPMNFLGKDQDDVYVYAFADGSEIRLSVPMGALTADPVKIELAGGITVVNQSKDGVMKYDTTLDTFTEDGTYLVRVMKLSDQSDAMGKAVVYQKNISFQIRSQSSRIPSVLSEPEGFSLVSARVGGRPVRDYRGTVFFNREGTYELRYQSDQQPGILYETEIIRDYSVPDVILPAPRKDGTYESPLIFSVSKPGCDVYLLGHGNRMRLDELVIQGAGEHVILVEDPYGNHRSVPVTVHKSGFSAAELLSSAGALCLAGYMIWMRYSSRHTDTR